MTRRTKLLNTAAVVALVATGVTAPAFAQDEAERVVLIEEILVTARKREENLQDIPLSVTAFTADAIARKGIRNLDDVAKLTPGFSLDVDFGRTASDRPVIRGQSNILGASGVSTFIDGVLIGGSSMDYDLNDVERIEVIKGPQSALYGRNTYSGAINIITKSPTDELSGNFKVEAAEFGQYEVSAALRGPITDTLAGSVNVRYYERGGPFMNEYDNTKVGQQESKSISGALYYTPNEELQIRARVYYSKLDDDQPRLFTTDPSENNCYFDDGGLYQGQGRYICGEIMDHPISIDDVRLVGEKGSDQTEQWQASVRVDYEINDNVSMTWINGYNDSNSKTLGDFGYNDESFNPFSLYLFPFGDFGFGGLTPAVIVAGPVTDFASAGKSKGWDYSSELRVNFEGDDWQATVGGYYYKSRSHFKGTRQVPDGYTATLMDAYFGEIARVVGDCNTASMGFFSCVSPVVNFGLDPSLWFGDLFSGNFIGVTMLEFQANRGISESERENYAAFAMLSYDVTEKLTLTGEARYADETSRSGGTTDHVTYDWMGMKAGRTRSDNPDRNASWDSISPRLTVSYETSDSSNIYAIVARGNKPGGFNSFSVEAQGLGSYDEETVWSYELGSKNVVMDGQMVFNMSAFYNQISGYQLTESVLNQAFNEPTTVITNKGKVNVAGIEFEVLYVPASLPGLTLSANYALADSNIREGTDINEGKLLDTLDDGLVNCSTGVAVEGEACGTLSDNVLPGSIVGRSLPRAPKHMFNVGFSYETPMTDDWNFVIGANLTHETKKFVQVHNYAFVGAATLLSASMGFESDTFGIKVWGKNMLGENSVVSASRFIDEGESFKRAFMGNRRLPSQFGVTGTYKF